MQKESDLEKTMVLTGINDLHIPGLEGRKKKRSAFQKLLHPLSIEEVLPPPSSGMEPVDLASEEERFHCDLNDCFELKKQIGRGGQGTVNRCKDLPLGRIVAVKSLLPELCSDPESREVFRREAAITAQLDHPSIVPIYSFCSSQPDGSHIVMKLVHGCSLEELLVESCDNFTAGRYDSSTEYAALRARIEIFLAVCNAMEYAHARGILHRDLKPDNVMVGSFHETYIMDWGLAEPYAEQPDAVNPPDPSITISGTPRYIAPEVLNRNLPDQRADIFALGMILYELVTLKHGVKGTTSDEVMHNIMQGRFEPVIHKFGIPVDGDLAAIIRKATAFHRGNRYRHVRDLSMDLRRWLDGLQVTARPDNLFRAAVRASARHRVALLLTSLTFVILFLLMTAHGLYGQWKRERQSRQYDNAMNQAAASCLAKADNISTSLVRAETSLLNMTSDARMILSGKISGSGNRNHPFYLTGQVPRPGGPDPAVVSNPIWSEISYGKAVLSPPKSSSPDRIRELERLLGHPIGSMRNTFFRINELQQVNLHVYPLEEMPCRAVFLALADHTMISFPATNVDYSNYDPANRKWFRDAAAQPEKCIWNEPYADVAADKALTFTASLGFRHPENGQLLGVMGIDITLKAVLRSLRDLKNRQSADGMLVDGKGRILASLDENLAPVVREIENVRFRQLDPELIRELIRKAKPFVHCVREEEGRKYAYFCSRISGPDWFYIEKTELKFIR